jgi:hypothetical protein
MIYNGDVDRYQVNDHSFFTYKRSDWYYGYISKFGYLPIPASLFANGEQGAWYDPSDLSTLFQDSAGTTPVTTAGQPVGKMLDKSGNDNHATQATSAARPTYQTAGGLHYLAFDGVDDAMATGTITPGVDKAQVFAGVRKLSDAASAVISELGPNITANDGSFGLFAPPSNGGNNYRFYPTGTVRFQAATSAATYAPPITNILTGLSDISGDLGTLRIDGGQVAQATGNLGTGNFLAYPLYIGARNGTSQFFNGNMYGLITRFGPNLTDAQIASTEAYIAAKTGVTL